MGPGPPPSPPGGPPPPLQHVIIPSLDAPEPSPAACDPFAPAPSALPSFPLNTRLRLGAGSPTHPAPAGTVRYVGPVAGTAPGTTWVGLEYDEAGRGKHDGSVKKGRGAGGSESETIRYFSVRPGAPTAGSLVRASALEGVAIRGVGLLEGVRGRYQAGVGGGEQAAAARAGAGPGAPAPPPPPSSPPHHHYHHHLAGAAEVAARQADLSTLAAACLAGSAVDGAGAADLTAALPALTDLDLSSSLVPDWRCGAAGLGRALPGLTRLSLAACGLGAGEASAGPGGDAPPPSLAPPPFPALRVLVLARTGLPWGAVVGRVAPGAPALEALSLAHCGLQSVAAAPPPGCLARLTSLDLAGNELGGRPALAGLWRMAAASLPALGSLDLTANAALFAAAAAAGEEGGVGAAAAAPAPASSAPTSLPGLLTLRLGGCGLTDWADVVALVGDGGGEEAGCAAAAPRPLAPALTSLRLTDNHFPAWSPSAGSHRADLVARLPARLARLNGAAVSGRERAEAVRALARARALEGPDGGGGGPPARPPLAASLAHLNLRFPCGAVHAVRLPASTTVGRLRMVAARLGGGGSGGSGGGGDVAALRAAPVGEGRDSPAAVVLAAEEDGRDLGFLGLGGGAEVWVG